VLDDDNSLGSVETLMENLCPTHVVGEMVRAHLRTGGKRLRARLAIAAATALGETPHIAWAAACELAHNATLVHDDIEDGDTVRRGQPTLWVQHGIAQAINAGDLLFMLPFIAVNQISASDSRRAALCELLARKVADIIGGQGLELQLRAEWKLDGYFAAIRGKTSGLFEMPVEGAALLAGHSAEAAGLVALPFGELGIVFQLQDDLVDLFGDKGREARGSDIREGKISALVVAHLALHPQDKEWLINILQKPRDETSNQEVHDVITCFEKRGARDFVLQQIEQFANEAKEKCQHAPVLRLLNQLLDVIVKPIR
jgi:geranylgeranyl diphosphate synthase, type I